MACDSRGHKRFFQTCRYCHSNKKIDKVRDRGFMFGIAMYLIGIAIGSVATYQIFLM